MWRGDRLKQLRERKSLTHQDLADSLGVGYAQIYRFESGKASPSAEILIKIAELFSVGTDYLLDRSDDATNHIRIDNLTPKEKAVLVAIRHGDVVEAIKAIVSDE